MLCAVAVDVCWFLVFVRQVCCCLLRSRLIVVAVAVVFVLGDYVLMCVVVVSMVN